MKFKKGDIVEVIKDDKWQGIDYPVGTQLRVCENQGWDSVVRIYDSMQKQGGCAKLWEWNLKLVKREEDENKLKFKEGQTYICTKSNLSWFTEGKEYPVLVTDFGKLAIRDDDESQWFDYELTGMTTCFKLKGVTETPDQKATKEEPTIYTKTEVIRQITNAYQHFKTDAERLAYLKGYFAK